MDMEVNDDKTRVKLQRFLRLVALRGGIQQAKVIALIVKKDRIALRNRALPSTDVLDWDLDGALQSLGKELGWKILKARYLGFHDLGGIRHYTFDVETENVSGLKYIEIDALEKVLCDEERKAIMTALKRRN
jgi:hypothetical protein